MPQRYYRKIIRIAAEHSPNVRRGLLQQQYGQEPDDKTIVPGVLTYHEYVKRRKLWDVVRQTIGLDARFYDGDQLLLFPTAWLTLAAQRAAVLRTGGVSTTTGRHALAIGVDPGEGTANTSYAAVDELGLIELLSIKTPDTTKVTSYAIMFGEKHGVPPEKWFFDRGGGGKQHADRLREQGYGVKTVAFGETVIPPLKRRGLVHVLEKRVEEQEERYTYVNRRAEMYGLLSILMDPSINPLSFALPAEDGISYGPQYTELRRQLEVFPKLYDAEGRMYLPPKNKKDPNSSITTLTDMLGCSPDEADALVLAVYGMLHKESVVHAGTMR